MAYSNLDDPDYLRHQRRLRDEFASGRPLKIPMHADERGSLLLLSRIDRYIAQIDQSRINARDRTARMNAARPRKGKKPPLYSEPEAAALRFIQSLGYPVRRMCVACGHDRTKNPRADGKCSVCCAHRRRLHRPAYRKTEHGRSVIRAGKSRRRARIRNAPINDLTAKDEAWVFKLYGTNCLKCGASPVALDHVIPLAQGGPHTASNLQPLCWVCNSSKCARNSADYRPFPYYSEIQLANLMSDSSRASLGEARTWLADIKPCCDNSCQ